MRSIEYFMYSIEYFHISDWTIYITTSVFSCVQLTMFIHQKSTFHASSEHFLQSNECLDAFDGVFPGIRVSNFLHSQEYRRIFDWMVRASDKVPPLCSKSRKSLQKIFPAEDTLEVHHAVSNDWDQKSLISIETQGILSNIISRGMTYLFTNGYVKCYETSLVIKRMENNGNESLRDQKNDTVMVMWSITKHLWTQK